MFTGIITDIGTVATVEMRGDMRARIECGYDMAGVDMGASIACDGICLTVVAKGMDWFEVDISAETLARTNIGAQGWQPGQRRERPRHAAEAQAHGDREVDDVAPGQELAQPEQVGELGAAQPPPLLHQHVAREREHAAEAHQPERKEAAEQPPDGRRRRSGGVRRRAGGQGLVHVPAIVRRPRPGNAVPPALFNLCVHVIFACFAGATAMRYAVPSRSAPSPRPGARPGPLSGPTGRDAVPVAPDAVPAAAPARPATGAARPRSRPYPAEPAPFVRNAQKARSARRARAPRSGIIQQAHLAESACNWVRWLRYAC